MIKHAKLHRINITIFIVFLLAGCQVTSPQSTHEMVFPAQTLGIVVPSSTIPATAVPNITLEATATVEKTHQLQSSPVVTEAAILTIAPIQPAYTPTELSPDFWMTLPITPTVSQAAQQIYQRGLEMGRDPHAFSKVGDCQSISTYFLTYFDMPGYYDLGTYGPLQQTLDWYAGSFSRESLAVKGGFNAAAILSPLRADPKQCSSSENPIACEYRLHNPSVALISLEEWWAGQPENYEKYMRQIIEYSIDQGVLPILATKADNLEGNHLINQTIAKLSIEYGLPLWNFWRAVQPLENHGLIAVDSKGEVDMFHLTHPNNYFFNDPSIRPSGWSMRNLTALQSLDAVLHGLTGQPR